MSTIDDEYFDRWFAEAPVMGIFRGQGLERTLELCEAAWSAGIRLVEVPVMGEDDLPVLAAAVEAGRRAGHEVGAGTVVTVAGLEAVHAVGAAFTVSPGFDLEVVEAGLALGLPHLPGVATATEIQAARRHGFTWLKAFPADRLGPEWIRAMHGPFPGVRFVATGGVHARNARDFLDAGCRAVALGSAFGTPDGVRAVAELLT